ncbi:MAG: hypothetical protein K9M56_06805 [Victivallales bacterium]|nr:hypothetical protein [Victivallales bacterium]
MNQGKTLRSIVIINPFSSRNYLSRELKKNNFYTIAVFTPGGIKKLNLYRQPVLKCFDEEIVADNNIDRIIAVLRKKNVLLVLYGFEVDIDIADKIANCLTPVSANPCETSFCRFLKHDISLKLKENCLTAPNDLRLDIDSADVFKQKINHVKFPAVLKPELFTGGSRNFHFIYNSGDLLETVDKLKEDKRLCSPRFILQEVITPDNYKNNIEYYYSVDSFSYRGEHYNFSVQRCFKVREKKQVTIHSMEQLCPSDSLYKMLCNHSTKVLKSLQHYNGFAHTQYYIINDEPVLLDFNPRIAGGQGVVSNMIELCLEVKPIDILKKCVQGETPNLCNVRKKMGYMLFIRKNPVEHLRNIKGLASDYSVKYLGLDTLRLYCITLINPDSEKCRKDCIRVLKSFQLPVPELYLENRVHEVF